MYLVHVAATGPRQAEMQRERGPVGAKNPGARKLLGVLSCWWNFTVQRLRANHTHTHTPHPTVQSVSRCCHFSSLLFLLPGPLLSCFTWLGTRASSLPFLRRQREPVKTYNPPPPSSAQNPPMTASALRVKDKGLLALDEPSPSPLISSQALSASLFLGIPSIHSGLRAFALALPSAWPTCTCLPALISAWLPSSLTSFKFLLKRKLLCFVFPPLIP